MNEIWKQYKDTQYSVSDQGRLRNDNTGTLLAGNITSQGYVKFGMWHNGVVKTVQVHRLVAETFIDNPMGKPVVNHKDSNPANNAVANLEWSTTAENIQHSYAEGNGKVGEESVHALLAEKDVILILERCARGESTADIAKAFGCSTGAISHIRLNKTWKHISRDAFPNLSQKGKLTPESVAEIRLLLADSVPKKVIAATYGVHRGTIAGIESGKIWKNH
jgi:hypothetical protein